MTIETLPTAKAVFDIYLAIHNGRTRDGSDSYFEYFESVHEKYSSNTLQEKRIRTDTVLQQVKTYSTCYSTPCAPCYITADPKTLSYPDFIDIQNETYTLNVTPRPTTFPNGSVSIAYETEKRNFSTVMSGSVSDLQLQLEEIYTWVVPGNAGTNLTL